MPNIAITSDATEFFGFAGAITGMSRTINTNIFKSDVLQFIHSEMAREFDNYAALRAGTQPEKFHHVYEWRMTGNPAAQLWRHKLAGPMNNKLATFEWVASKTPILTPRERKSNPRDRMSNVSETDIAKYSNRRYIFHWKAPMMEFGMDTIIQHKWAKALVFPETDNSGVLRVTERTISKTAGGENTHGSFMTLWAEWWETQSSDVFDDRVQKIVQNDMAESVFAGMRQKSTRGPMTLKIGAVTSQMAAKAAGRSVAEAYLKSKARSYRTASAYMKEGA